MKEYEVKRTIIETFYVNGKNKKEAYKQCFENGDAYRSEIKSLKAKVIKFQQALYQIQKAKNIK